MGWPKPPQALGGGPATPKSPKPILTYFSFFFFFGLLVWLDHPLGHGGGSTTPRPPVGVALATPWKKNRVAEPPHFGHGGGWSHPRFSSFFFFFS
jgi:hypothetical protein